MSLDHMDKILDRVRFIWEREDKVQEELSASKIFGLILVSSICGRIHALSTDEEVALMDDEVLRKQELQKLFDKNSDWSRRTFFVDRLYHFRTETYNVI